MRLDREANLMGEGVHTIFGDNTCAEDGCWSSSRSTIGGITINNTDTLQVACPDLECVRAR